MIPDAPSLVQWIVGGGLIALLGWASKSAVDFYRLKMESDGQKHGRSQDYIDKALAVQESLIEKLSARVQTMEAEMTTLRAKQAALEQRDKRIWAILQRVLDRLHIHEPDFVRELREDNKDINL